VSTVQNPYAVLTPIKLNKPACTFQFVCKHTELKQATLPELWELQRCKNGKIDLQPHSRSLAIVSFERPYI